MAEKSPEDSSSDEPRSKFETEADKIDEDDAEGSILMCSIS